MVANGTDVLLTTQYLEEADHLARQVVIIDHGRVIAEGSPAELKSRAGRDVIELHACNPADLARLADVVGRVGVEAPRTDPGTRTVTVPVDGGTATLPAAIRAIDEAGLRVEDIAVRRPTLDEVFLTLTGEPIDEAA
jgi:ABC-type multidrug transport system ATPase subunit